MKYKVGDVIAFNNHRHLVIQVIDGAFRTIDLDAILTYKIGEYSSYPVILNGIDKEREVKDYLDDITEIGVLLTNIKKNLTSPYYKDGEMYYKVLNNNGEEVDLLIVNKEMSISRYSLPIKHVKEKFKQSNKEEFDKVYNDTKKLLML